MKTLVLSESMKMGWAMLIERRERQHLEEARFIGNCLIELGGDASEPWKWDGEKFIKDDDERRE